ncbi:MAG: DEAD/DEAH box helicase family protein [Candidatus Dadabacteria bacterium]|nr:DEAD/DEAH box helicase family protein [Candidatus Dadabacteria bacterium]
MSSVLDLLEIIREKSSGSADKGRRFERLVKTALDQHPVYGENRFSHLWLWNDWPDREGGDFGIDIVGEETDGGLCAIQCKCYDSAIIPNGEIDKFLAAAGPRWTSRILVATSDYSDYAARKLKEHNVEVITSGNLAEWKVAGEVEKLLREPETAVLERIRHSPFPHQEEALRHIERWYSDEEPRGRIIMPCGTGKSLVAMWAAERNVGNGGQVLYLVPSIALMGQTMRVWASQRSLPHSYIGVCSDTKAGRNSEDADLTELAMPVTTRVEKVADELKKSCEDALTVVFSTYQSLEVVCEAQAQAGSGFAFDLVICDEAHRTAGVESEDRRSPFLIVHDEICLRARRRLYMTATQRIYTPAAKRRAAGGNADLYSMDDEAAYGSVLFDMKFGEAVDRGLLSDYQVVVIGYDQAQVVSAHNSYVTEKGANISTEQWIQMIGCWDALADPETNGPDRNRPAGIVNPDATKICQRAIAFSNTISSSKNVAGHWSQIVEATTGVRPQSYREAGRTSLDLEVKHIDGTMNAYKRHQALNWLRADPTQGEARVVTNARCLTEGVDVPALDAVLFLAPKRSDIEIVQAVGRVMRKAPGKQTGYIVLPVLVPEGCALESEKVLSSSDFARVWDVLRALRSHDERLDAYVNSVHLAKKIPNIILIDNSEKGRQQRSDVGNTQTGAFQLALPNILPQSVASAIVEKVGDRQYWPRWGQRVARISREVETRITDLATQDASLSSAYKQFLEEMRAALHPGIDENHLAQMISHHIVTMPVFEALFSQDQFRRANPISQAMDRIVGQLEKSTSGGFSGETRELEPFYRQTERQLSDITDSEARLEILLNLYESFFKYAMPDETKKLGIVYTPTVLVDFIIRSTDSVCRKKFGVGLGDKNVCILDPFTGTGTFIHRLLTIKGSEGRPIIKDADFRYKYEKEILAAELLMLAYYIAALKIEESYRQRCPQDDYREFGGITLMDTFATNTKRSQQSLDRVWLEPNYERANRQSRLPIRVIMGNPPWSAGQKSAGDDNPNMNHPDLEKRVRGTYGKYHKEITGRSAGGNSSGNLYVQAIRWASDRVIRPSAEDGERGGSVIAFIHPNSLTDGTSLAGMRAALRAEFSDIYVVNLLGDAYKSGEEFRKEGEKIFGQGSRNGVQITVLVHDPKKPPDKPAELRYAEVPEYSSLEQKLEWLNRLGDVLSEEFSVVPVNKRHDWKNLTDGTFETMMPLCSSKTSDHSVVRHHASGIKTNCDAYVYSFSRKVLIERIKALIDAYEKARRSVSEDGVSYYEATVNNNLSVIKWTDTLKQSLRRGHRIEFDESRIREVLYRPFTKIWLYEDDRILSSVKTVSKMFGKLGGAILISGTSNRTVFTPMATESLPDLCAAGTNQPCRAIPRGGQC